MKTIIRALRNKIRNYLNVDANYHQGNIYVRVYLLGEVILQKTIKTGV